MDSNIMRNLVTDSTLTGEQLTNLNNALKASNAVPEKPVIAPIPANPTSGANATTGTTATKPPTNKPKNNDKFINLFGLAVPWSTLYFTIICLVILLVLYYLTSDNTVAKPNLTQKSSRSHPTNRPDKFSLRGMNGLGGPFRMAEYPPFEDLEQNEKDN